MTNRQGALRMPNTVLANPWVRFAGGAALLVMAALAAWLLIPVLTPVLFAFIFAYCFHPVVVFLEKRRISRGFTILALVLVVALLVVAVPLAVVPGVIHEADGLVQAARTGIGNGWVDRLLDRLPLRELVVDLGWAPEGKADFNARMVLAERLGQLVKDNALQIVRGYGDRIVGFGRGAGLSAAHLLGSVARLGLGLLGGLVSLSLFLFVAVEMLKNYEKMVETVAGLIPPRYRGRVDGVMGKIDVQLKSFLRGQLTVCAVLMGLYAVGLSLCGVPFALLIAIMGGAANIVPYAGPAITLAPSLLLTLLTYGIDGHLIGLGLVFVCIQMCEGYVLTPRIVGSQVGLNPAWVIVAILVFSSVLGFFGLLLAVPIAAVSKVLILEAITYYKVSPAFRDGASSVSPSSSSPSSSDPSSSSDSASSAETNAVLPLKRPRAAANRPKRT
jgi:predicted PurR-regulated permease PerM